MCINKCIQYLTLTCVFGKIPRKMSIHIHLFYNPGLDKTIVLLYGLGAGV